MKQSALTAIFLMAFLAVTFYGAFKAWELSISYFAKKVVIEMVKQEALR